MENIEKLKSDYINQILFLSLQEHCLNMSGESTRDLIQDDNFNGTVKKISYTEACRVHFENGLDINHFIKSESYSMPITMIEDLTIHSSNAESLGIIYDHISYHFIQGLPYSEKKSILTQLTTKAEAFFSDGEIEYLLRKLYGKGFKIEQEEENSIEVSWIDNFKTYLLQKLFEFQPDFNFDFKYNYEGQKMDFTSIIEYKILKAKREQYTGHEGDLINLEQILETANTLIIFQTLCENNKNTQFIEDENNNFKL